MNEINIAKTNRTIKVWQATAFTTGSAHAKLRVLIIAQIALASLIAISTARPAHASIPAAQQYFDADGLLDGTDGVTILSGSKALAVGAGAHALASRAIAIGWGAGVSNWAGIAVGSGASVAGYDAVAIGEQALGTATGAFAGGVNARANLLATTIGAYSAATGDRSSAFGAYSSASGRASLALGQNALAAQENSVALGAGSVTQVGARAGYLAYGLPEPQTSAGEVNVGQRTISGVAAGAADQDAVNVAQLKALDSKIDAATARLANTLTYESNGDGSVNRNSIVLNGEPGSGGTQIHNVADAHDAHDAVNLGQLSTMLASAVGNVAANGASPFFGAAGDAASEAAFAGGAHSIAAGASARARAEQAVALGADAQADGTNAVALGAHAQAAGMNAVALGVHARASNTNAIASGVNANASGANAIATGANASATSTNAIATGANASASGSHALALGASATASADNSVALGYGSVADRANSVSIGSPGNERRIAHVAPAIDGTDAVNLNQLTQSMNGALGAANRYTDDKIRSLRRDAYGGTAAALAVAALPQAMMPGRGMVALAGGTYGGQSALAIGVSQLSDTGQWAVRMQGTASSRGEAGLALGAGTHW
ncbi:YadA family autotransporter adhesin [Paraburkholderia rhizosphaerae]|uniref:Trimeric autotransporter adhesin n=1 Tax=Paraburkholderia rhizosphaerae TaxID=480658 RepID=A0A4R8LJT6_9BURK|nr:YadA-like family protein [Paraburkholderia rhizosphaerae]TDY42738.1 trimeric autotransporter adhesin [Paraburkholderia rhizosphaerae]